MLCKKRINIFKKLFLQSSQGLRLATQMSMLTQSLVKLFDGGSVQNATASQITITQGVRAFPQSYSTALYVPVGTLIGNVLFPFGISFLLPTFVITLVKEKEERM
jgi:hypothetical protein